MACNFCITMGIPTIVSFRQIFDRPSEASEASEASVLQTPSSLINLLIMSALLFLSCVYGKKLDGIGPINNRPSTE